MTTLDYHTRAQLQTNPVKLVALLCAEHYSRGWRQLKTLPSHRKPLVFTLITLWLIGVAGDGFTTYFALRDSRMEEANPLVAPFFELFGVGPWLLVISAMCLFFSVFTLARPRYSLIYPIFGGVIFMLSIKLFAVANNTLVLVFDVSLLG